MKQYTNGHADDAVVESSEPEPPAPAPRSVSPYGTNDPEFFEHIRQNDLDPKTVEALNNMFSRQTILGNIKDAEHHELKWLARNMVDRVAAQFPPKESAIQGDYRAFLMNDPDDRMTALDDRQIESLRQAVWSYMLDLSRSVGGFQQNKLSDIHQTYERKSSESSGKKSIWSVFD